MARNYDVADGVMLFVIVGFLGGIGIQLLEGARTAATAVNSTSLAIGYTNNAINGIVQIGTWFSLGGTTVAAVFILSMVGMLFMVFGGRSAGASS